MSDSNPPTDNAPVLVTGATGFVAGHCILKLLDEGYRVRGTVRDPDRIPALKTMLERNGGDPEQVEFVTADLSDDAGWAKACEGIDKVLHVASPLPRVLPKDADELVRPARDGTLRVLRAASAAGVERVVLTSSNAAVCYGRGDIQRPFTEDDWSDPGGTDHSVYTLSKTLSERAAWEFMDEDDSGMELVSVNPGLVLGPVLEEDYGTSAEAVLKLMNGEFPGLPRIGFPLVDARDVADLHHKAMIHPDAAGERFLCTGDFWWIEEIAEELRRSFPEQARRVPTRRLPDWLMRIAGLFDPVTRGVLFELGVRRPCDCRKARNVLGWQPRSNAEAVRATAETLIRLGLVKSG